MLGLVESPPPNPGVGLAELNTSLHSSGASLKALHIVAR